MTYTYQPTDPHALIRQITEEAYCILEMQMEAQEHTEEADLYLASLALVGKAWDMQEEAETVRQTLDDFAQNPDAAAPEADDSVPMEERILSELWGLFDTAVRLENQEEREQIRQLAQQMMDFHGLDMRVQNL